jgi:hypothetical protein
MPVSHRCDPIGLNIRQPDREEVREAWHYHENGGITVVVQSNATGLSSQVRIPAWSLREWAKRDSERAAARKSKAGDK